MTRGHRLFVARKRFKRIGRVPNKQARFGIRGGIVGVWVQHNHVIGDIAKFFLRRSIDIIIRNQRILLGDWQRFSGAKISFVLVRVVLQHQ